MSQRQIAEALGVDESTVRADKGAGNPADTDSTTSNGAGPDGGSAGNPAHDAVDLSDIKTPEERQARIDHSKQVDQMTARIDTPIGDNFERAKRLTMKQAIDLIEKRHLSPGEVVDLYLGAGIEIALVACHTKEVVDALRRLADELEAGRDLN